MKPEKNLLLILSDQHSREVMGAYGDRLGVTPNLDRLAARGVTFDAAYTPAPLCTPARMAMLTGRYSHEIGCWTNSDALASDLPTHAHSLGAAGYDPVLVGRLHAIGPDQMHGYGERLVGEHSTNWIGGYAHSLGVLDRTNDPFRVSVMKSGAGQSSYEVKDRDVIEAALSRLDDLAGAGQPFAMTVGLILPHQPYVCSPDDYARFEGRLGLPRLPRPGGNSEHPWLRAWRDFTETVEVPDEATIRARTAYYGLTFAMDRMIGRILDRLEERGLRDDTLVVYVSDHGDQLGERGLWWKQTFYDQSVAVPLTMSWPGVLPEGERRSQAVNLIDLTATMLAAVGAPSLPNATGRSFLEVAKDGDSPWISETFSEYCTDGMARWTPDEPVQQRMVRTGRWKLVDYHGYGPQLFDLENDPDEQDDLAEHPRAAAVRDALTKRVRADWDPEAIRRTMATRVADKRLLQQWARGVRPAESHHWQVRMEDNWLDDRTDG
jgi:choline-sulfatase